MERHLHVVSFNVPWPADYGGVIDVFYRLKALHEAGVKVHLHCFTYGRPEAPELEHYCEEVCYYRRDMSPWKFFDRRPFIVSSRDNKTLRRRLMQDDYPVLLEGLHCCSLLEHLPARRVYVRAHNIESDYYARLAASEKNFWRKRYLKVDAARIRRYESILTRATAVFSISQADKEKLEQMGCRNVLLVTAGHPFSSFNIQHSSLLTPHSSLITHHSYALYHGNLSVAENYEAVCYLLDHVFYDGRHPLVVAGKEPPAWLRMKIEHTPGATLVASPDNATLQRLVSEAQVNVLVTHQPTGLKLKLLQTLFQGRHCLVNSDMVAGTGLAPLCVVTDTPETMREQLDRLMAAPFDEAQLDLRRAALQPYLTSTAIQPLLLIIQNS